MCLNRHLLLPSSLISPSSYSSFKIQKLGPASRLPTPQPGLVNALSFPHHGLKHLPQACQCTLLYYQTELLLGGAESHPLPLSSVLHTVGAQQTHVEETNEWMNEANAESKFRFKEQHSGVSPPREPIEIVPVFLLCSDVSILRCRCSESLSASTKWGYWKKGARCTRLSGCFQD